MAVKVAIADSFLESLAKLGRKQSKKVLEFVAKFRANPDSPGINYEKFHNAREKGYRSVRIDQAYRGIVLKPDTGNVYVLLWVDHHDKAYDWAAKTRCAVHPETGVLQLYETETVEADEHAVVASTPEVALAASKPSSEPLFDLTQEQLLRIGVPEAMLETVVVLGTEAELEAIESRLPVEAFEALYLHAGGSSWAEIEEEYCEQPPTAVDTNDLEAALDRDSSRRRFHVVEDELELKEMLEAPLERWRVFLHPSQRKLVDRSWNGPVRVLGGAGTGKTVVAMHRAAWLVRNVLDTNERVLFLTFNVNLAADIAQNLKKIMRPDELDRIEVVNIDAWVSRFLKKHQYAHKVVWDWQLRDQWARALALKSGESDLPDSFYREEWERVVLPQRILGRDDYLKASRKGRGVALSRRQRTDVWPVFDELRSQMQQAGLRTYQDASLDACELLSGNADRRPYRSVVVDEAQDMGPEALKLIRELATEDKDDLFFVGDGHQRIYRRRAVMGQCGIKIVGRSRKLKINYRTTEQIRRFASSILDGVQVDDLDDGSDSQVGYRSLFFGEVPDVQGYSSFEEELASIAALLKSLEDQGQKLTECCVVARTRNRRDEIADGLRSAAIEVTILEQGADNPDISGVRVATMHRVKGLEFRHMFIASMSKGLMPLEVSLSDTEDPVEAQEREFSERALLHVAASRAISSVYVSYSGEPSEFLNM